MFEPDYKKNDPKGWCGNRRYGAAMGRPTIKGERTYAGRLYVRRIRLNDGGYDANGTYFGHGDPLWWVVSPDYTIDRVYREKNRLELVEQLAADYPWARFYGRQTPLAGPCADLANPALARWAD